MIQIPLTTAILLYSAILGLLTVLIWLYTEFSGSRSRRFLAQQALWRCVFCGYTYLDERAEQVSRCPRCASYNALTDKHARFVHVPTHTAPPDQDTREKNQLPRPLKQGPNPSRRKRPHQRHHGPRRH